jgi:hypothetical protein
MEEQMLKVIIAGLLSVLGVISVSAGEQIKSQNKDIITQHEQWIAAVLKEIETIKVGMTRKDILKVFTTEGGLSTRSRRTFVHKECVYIKVDVEFKPIKQKEQKLKELPDDQIISISRPYLQWSITD